MNDTITARYSVVRDSNALAYLLTKDEAAYYATLATKEEKDAYADFLIKTKGGGTDG